MHKIHRRDFLRIGAGAAVVLGASPLLADCGGDSENKVAPPAASPTAASNKTQVAAIKGTDLREMTRNALEAMGGIGAFVHEGETVFIKPNFVTIGWQSIGRDGIGTGECTKPDIVIALAEECLKAGAKEVTIGDAAQTPRWDWSGVKTLDGSTSLPAEAARLSSAYGGKVTLACLDSDSPSWVDIPSKTSLGTIAVSSLVANADRVFSVPVLKTHQWAQMTLAQKCFLGTTPLDRYGAKPDGSQARILLHAASGGIEQVFLDIVAAVKPVLAIIDASMGIEGDGPALAPTKNVKTVDVKERLGGWVLLAGKDLAACDATACRMTGQDLSKIRQLQLAQEQGLGETREERIEVIGERFESLKMEWIPPSPPSPTDLTACPSYPHYARA